MPNPKLTSLFDPFTAASINAALWNNVTGGAATLDQVNDMVVLAQPTVSGTTNTFGTTALFDATAGTLYAQVGTVPKSLGGTRTVLKLLVDASNSVAMRLDAGNFWLDIQTAGTTAPTALPAYDPHAHRWWQLREASGRWYADTSPDGLNWVNLASVAYAWSPAAMSLSFQTGASITETAGNVATIAHINTRVGGANANWPTIEDGWGASWNAGGGNSPLDRYVEVTDRTQGAVTVSRGRQYETDQVRSGESSLTLENKDGSLDPVNTAGPFAGHIAPYQPYRRRAQWPPTRNLLEQAAATGGDLGGYALGAMPVAADVLSDTDTSNGSLVASASAWQGGVVFQFSVPSASAIGQRPCHTSRYSVTPGQQYTMQMRIRDVTASTSLSVKAHIGWYTAGGGNSPTTYTYGSTAVLTGSTTAGWTTITVTGTAPANAAGIDVGVALAVAAAATCSVQVDGWQVEKGATASPWTCPGIWSPIYAGFSERWTPTWNMSGTYGVVSPTAVDALALLSQKQLSDPLTQEINSNAPRFLYKLDDPAGSTSAADATGNYPAAPLAIGKYGAGSAVFGTAITAVDTVNGVYTGSSGSVFTVNNPSYGTNNLSGVTFLDLAKAGITGPANPSGTWSRMFAFRATGGNPPIQSVLWSSFDKTPGSSSRLYWQITSTGVLQLVMAGPTSSTTTTFQPSNASVADGNWHLVSFSYSHANAQFQINQDGVSVGYTNFNPATEPLNLVSESVGGWVDPTTGYGSSYSFKGDISFVAEFPVWLGNAAMVNLYQAWKSSCSGESTDARYSRILRYSGYIGPSSVQAGLTTSMGPAAIDGQDAVTALQAVVDTEGGAHFVARDGSVVFRSRAARYNATVPMFTFGERGDLGEWPYEDCSLDFDSTHLSNQVTVTRESGQQAFYAQDAASITSFFPRTMTRTVNSSSALECQDAANYLLSRYKNPAMRVSAIKLHPSAAPAMWPVCLALELGTRVRVMKRPPNAPAITVDCFVENIQWDMGGAEAFVTLQCSPADTTPYSVFAAWHTTLKTTVASGVASITVNPSADTVNPLAAQLGPGQQIVLGQGTANAETVTVLSVGATSSGWTSAVITLSANTTKGHTAGDSICEPLPSGVTDPTTYDAACAFDAVAFAY